MKTCLVEREKTCVGFARKVKGAVETLAKDDAVEILKAKYFDQTPIKRPRGRPRKNPVA
jgi:hypothetical protein